MAISGGPALHVSNASRVRQAQDEHQPEREQDDTGGRLDSISPVMIQLVYGTRC
jgi:hypothetical protein